jgi:protein-arginine kinase activator protein McsA
MKKIVLAVLISLISTLSIGQESPNQKRIKAIPLEIQQAVKSENFEKAAELKKEKELREELEKAIKSEDFAKASQLKSEIDNLNQEEKKQAEIAKLNKELELAVKSEDYAKAKELKNKIEELKTGKPAQPAVQSEPAAQQATASSQTTQEKGKPNPANAGLVTTAGYAPPSPGKAVIYFTRVSALGYAVAFEYFHQDQYLGSTKGVSLIRYEVEPGEHLFWASGENVEFITIDAEAGKTYLVYVDVVMGFSKARVHLSPVFPEQTDRIQRGAEVIAKHPPIIETPEEINAKMEKLNKRGWIADKLNAYETKWKSTKGYARINANQNIPEDRLRL